MFQQQLNLEHVLTRTTIYHMLPQQQQSKTFFNNNNNLEHVSITTQFRTCFNNNNLEHVSTTTTI